jgi:hypothetical protein
MRVALDIIFRARTSLMGAAVDGSLGPGFVQVWEFKDALQLFEAGEASGIGAGSEADAALDDTRKTACDASEAACAAFGSALSAMYMDYMRASGFAKGDADGILMRALNLQRQFLVDEQPKEIWHTLLDALGVAGSGTQPNCSPSIRYRMMLAEVLKVWWAFLTGTASKDWDPRLAEAEEGTAASSAAPASVAPQVPDATVVTRIAGALVHRISDLLAARAARNASDADKLEAATAFLEEQYRLGDAEASGDDDSE